MKHASTRSPWTWGTLVASGLLAVACSSGSGPNSTRTTPEFQVENISVRNGETWKLNNPIDITFTRDIDFETVTLNSIQITQITGQPATGSFSLRADGRTVRFQPSCPTLADASDAGLKPGKTYVLHVLGTTTGGVTIRSTSGEALELSQSVTFVTPNTDNPLALFLDTVPGPPSMRVRGRGGVGVTATNATHVEIGGDENQVAYFVWNAQTQQARLELEDFLEEGDNSNPLMPLNLYSDTGTKVSVIVEVDQPVRPGDVNISGDLIGLEYLPQGSSSWQRVDTQAELVENCTASGATIRLTPFGILPQAAGLRVNMRQGFKDLTGDATILDQANFAMMDTTESDNPIPTDTGVQSKIGADEILESFVLSGNAEGSLEDTGANFSTPFADWGGGTLQASFSFGGSGGPGGDFDWFIPEETTIVLDTVSTTIQGGPGGIATTTQSVINGVVDVRNMRLPASSSIIVQGPNPCTILASGDVEIYGTFSIAGSNSPGVGTLNTTNLPEPGASGQAGGGAGGTGSFLTNQSTPRGGRGFGAFNQVGGGGQGGETGYAASNKNNRRGAGGGGGRFGPDVRYVWNQDYSPQTGGNPPSGDITWPPALQPDRPHPEIDRVLCQELIGLDAEPGRMGGPGGLGAESQSQRAQGGEVGPSPFLDDNPDNNFYGAMLVDPGGSENLVIGELDRVWAGAGGGGGGDAVKSTTFPLTPFTIIGDEKGAGGGGGAGGLQILAVGDIIVGTPGATEFSGGIVAEGGDGGGGENTNYFDRVGGGSGAGSGGHVVLSSAKTITVNGHTKGHNQSPDLVGRWYNEPDHGHFRRIISLTGGQGGAGQGNKGGAKETGETAVRCDDIPHEAFPAISNLTANIWPYPLGNVGGVGGPNDTSDDYTCFAAQDGILFTPDGDRLNWGGDPDMQASPGAGGDGSPGILQLHVSDPLTNLMFPDCETLDGETGEAAGTTGTTYGEGLDVTQAVAPPPLGWHTLHSADYMVPFFSAESTARSVWIPLGLANVSPESAGILYQEYLGTEPTDGKVDIDGTSVVHEAPVVGPVALGATAGYVDDDTRLAMVFDASGMTGINQVYRRNPNLLRNFSVRVSENGDPDNNDYFSIASASYDSTADEVTVTVSGSSPIELDGVSDAATRFEIVPHMFRLETSELEDFYPSDAEVRVRFAGTWQGDDGVPIEITEADWVTDIRDLNDPVHPQTNLVTPYDYVSFEVFFTLNRTGNPDLQLSSSTPRPALRFLRIPFQFGNTDGHVAPLNP